MPNHLPSISSLLLGSTFTLAGCPSRDTVFHEQQATRTQIDVAVKPETPPLKPDVWSLPDGEIPLDLKVFVNIADPAHPGKITQVSVRFSSANKILYFDERPFALYSIGRLKLRCKVTRVVKKNNVITITGKAIIGAGSSDWTADKMQDLCCKVREPDFEKYEFPLKTSIGLQTGRIVPIEEED